jgi:hypothetical protein
MKKEKPKYAYVCSVAWTHEVGRTDVDFYASPKDIDHPGCGIVKVKVTPVREVKKEDLSLKHTIPIGRVRHEQMKSVRAQIRYLQAFYKKLEKEPRIPRARGKR